MGQASRVSIPRIVPNLLVYRCADYLECCCPWMNCIPVHDCYMHAFLIRSPMCQA